MAPISREEFRNRRIDLTLPIVGMLEDYPDLAFTSDEVHQMLAQTRGRDATPDEVNQALQILVTQR
ncbi:MAG: hypothetical protein ACE5Q6_04335, partial [Dehalococcoidia bacterium]